MEERKSTLTCLVVLILTLPYANATLLRPKAKNHFVLVHGGCHGDYKIVALMRSSGHNVTAIDYGASPLMEFMASLPAHEKVILVDHNFGGFVISKSMESYPEKISAFASTEVLAALDNRVTYDNRPKNPPTTFSYGPKYLEAFLYQLSPTKDLALATTLVRPVYLFSVGDVSKELVLSKKKKEFQKSMIERNPPDEVEVIHGSDQMIMMSKPLQLFTCLQSIAKKYG
ncbi:unnamed protein product [Withania somnifera]